MKYLLLIVSFLVLLCTSDAIEHQNLDAEKTEVILYLNEIDNTYSNSNFIELVKHQYFHKSSMDYSVYISKEKQPPEFS